MGLQQAVLLVCSLATLTKGGHPSMTTFDLSNCPAPSSISNARCLLCSVT